MNLKLIYDWLTWDILISFIFLFSLQYMNLLADTQGIISLTHPFSFILTGVSWSSANCTAIWWYTPANISSRTCRKIAMLWIFFHKTLCTATSLRNKKKLCILSRLYMTFVLKFYLYHYQDEIIKITDAVPNIIGINFVHQ